MSRWVRSQKNYFCSNSKETAKHGYYLNQYYMNMCSEACRLTYGGDFSKFSSAVTHFIHNLNEDMTAEDFDLCVEDFDTAAGMYNGGCIEQNSWKLTLCWRKQDGLHPVSFWPCWEGCYPAHQRVNIIKRRDNPRRELTIECRKIRMNIFKKRVLNLTGNEASAPTCRINVGAWRRWFSFAPGMRPSMRPWSTSCFWERIQGPSHVSLHGGQLNGLCEQPGGNWSRNWAGGSFGFTALIWRYRTKLRS